MGDLGWKYLIRFYYVYYVSPRVSVLMQTLVFVSLSLGWGLKFCISNKFLYDSCVSDSCNCEYFEHKN